MAGRPLYEWSLRALREAGSIGQIVIAAPPGNEPELAGEGVDVVTGGATRSDSVLAAMQVVDADLVAIHDAARPLLSAELLDALVAALGGDPGAAGVIAAAPVTDTIKRALGARLGSGGIPPEALTIADTPARDRLWAAQTPQVFRCADLREALAGEEGRHDATDEASLVERRGGRVMLHHNPSPNPKVTTAADLSFAESLLRG